MPPNGDRERRHGAVARVLQLAADLRHLLELGRFAPCDLRFDLGDFALHRRRHRRRARRGLIGGEAVRDEQRVEILLERVRIIAVAAWPA